MSKLFLLLSLFSCILVAQEFSLSQFIQALERNSISLIGDKARFESLLEEQKSLLSWDYPYVETNVVFANNQKKVEPQTSALLMLIPKLPWVSSMLRQSLNIKNIEYKKSYELSKNLVFIAAKRLYLTYKVTQEKYNIYTKREDNYRSQLAIAKKRLDAGSMSQKDYINFRNSYLEAKLARTYVHSTLIDLKKMLEMLLGIESLKNAQDIRVPDLDFDYVKIVAPLLEKMLEHSPYTEIINLQAKDYQTNAKLVNRDRLNSLGFGAGVENANGNTNLALRFQIPLPITPQNTHLKKKFLALQSGAIAQSQITQRNIKIKTSSYLAQLVNQEKYIQIQKENIANKKQLQEMGKIAYNSQKIGLFEYLAYQNSYMDSLTALADAKLNYINITALLEETLGKTLTNLGEKE